MGFSLNRKIEKMLNLLVGLRNPDIVQLLSSRGFTHEDLKEGWDLFLKAVGYREDFEVMTDDSATVRDKKTMLRELDQWENDWFPVVDATLQRRFESVHRKVFLNLSRSRGKMVLESVETILDRIESLKKSQQEKAAMDLLEKRGLDAEERGQARDLIREIREADGSDPGQDELERHRMQTQGALDEAWAWYKEWSRIARTLIKRNDVLIRLGIRERSSTARRRR